MTDQDYQKKLEELQASIPFLESTIKRLKQDTVKSREAQIAKLESLLTILTNKKRKLKFDVLIKCEEVIVKLHQQVEKRYSDNMQKFRCKSPPEDKLTYNIQFSDTNPRVNSTPASPSPPLESFNTIPEPVVIPTETITESNRIPSFSNTGCSQIISTQNVWNSNFSDTNYSVSSNTNWSYYNFENNWNYTDFSDSQWSEPNEPLYYRRNEIFQNHNHNKDNFTPTNERLIDNRGNEGTREINKDNFTITMQQKNEKRERRHADLSNLKKIPLNPVSKENLNADTINVDIKKRDLIKIQFPVNSIPANLSKPPLSDTDLQDLLSSSSPASSVQSPKIDENMDIDKLEEMKTKLYKELEKNLNKVTVSSSKTHVHRTKPPKVIEKVIKEPDNVFGNLLSSIDEQIMNKNKEHKKHDKKHSKSKEHKEKEDKLAKNKSEDISKTLNVDKEKNKNSTKEDKIKDKSHKEDNREKDDAKHKHSKEHKDSKDKLTEAKNKSKSSKDNSKDSKDKNKSSHDKSKCKDSKDKHGGSKEKQKDAQKDKDKAKDAKDKSNDSKDMNQNPKIENKDSNKDNKIKETKTDSKEETTDVKEKNKNSSDTKKDLNNKNTSDDLQKMTTEKDICTKDKQNNKNERPNSDLNEKPVTTGRLSDKYPHKRKSVSEKQGESADLESDSNYSKSKPLTTEVHPRKFIDQSRIHPPPAVSLPLNPSPDFSKLNRDYAQNNNRPLSRNSDSDYSNNQMNPHISNESFQFGNCNYKNMPEDMRNQKRNLNYSNQFTRWNPSTPSDPFSSHNYVDHSNTFPNAQQYTNNQILRRINNGNYPSHNMENNYSQYDLSQMTPIDFYECAENSLNRNSQQIDFNNYNGSFRGGCNRGKFIRSRGNFKNIQYVNPMRRESSKEHNLERYHKDTEEFSKDPRKYTKFSNFDESRIEKISNEDPRRHSKFREDNYMPINDDKISNEDPRRYSRFREDNFRYKSNQVSNEEKIFNEDPRKHSRSRDDNFRTKPNQVANDDERNSNEDLRKYSKSRDENFSMKSTQVANDEEKICNEDPRRYSRSRDESFRAKFNSKTSIDENKRQEAFKNKSKYESNLDKKFDNRKFSRSGNDSKDGKEEIQSPLTSLYSNETKQVGKGYGIQKFKIPKIRKSVEDNKESKDQQKNSCDVESTEKNDDSSVIKKEDLTVKKEITNEVTKEPVASSLNEEKIVEKSSDKNETDMKLEMFNNFLKHMFETFNSNTLIDYLDKCGLTLPKSKTKRIKRIIDSDSESDEDEKRTEQSKSDEHDKTEKQDKPNDESKVKKEENIDENEKTKKEESKNDVKIINVPSKVESVANEDENDVVESVGERIKQRRRNPTSQTDVSPDKTSVADNQQDKPKKARRKNALELLQEDLKDMFISEGVLTANGKRMCRIMKEHEETGLYKELDSPKASSSNEDEDMPLLQRKTQVPAKQKRSSSFDKLKMKSRTSPRVVLEKISVPANKNQLEGDNEVEEKQKVRQKRVTTVQKYVCESENDDEVTNKSKNDDDKEQENEISTEIIENEVKIDKKVVKRKRKGKWSQGIIKKKSGKLLKSPETLLISNAAEINESEISIKDLDNDIEIINTSRNSDNEEFAFLKIDTTPDVSYYLTSTNKYDCKLCEYKGKWIVHHYRNKHPEAENMISRLSPEQAQQAIEESIKNDFEKIVAVDEFLDNKKRRTTFICRFCDGAFNSIFSAKFYDHITCHTGEYRYKCKLCNFCSGIRKTLNAHYHNAHTKSININPSCDAAPNFRIVFGYLCKACNFTQLLKENVETHIKVSHPDQNIDIIKINLSSNPSSLDGLTEENVENTECDTNVEINVQNSVSESKELNMTAFVASDNASLREKLIEDERLQKMQEINSNLAPRRSSLNFINQLKDKLENVLANSEKSDKSIQQQENTNEIPKDDVINVENTSEIIQDSTSLDVSIDDDIIEIQKIVQDNCASENLGIKIANTCSLIDEEIFQLPENKMIEEENEDTLKSNTSDVESLDEIEPIDFDDVPLSFPTDIKQKGVLNTIQRLAANLQNPVQQNLPIDELLRITQDPVLEMSDEDIRNKSIPKLIINGGSIEIHMMGHERSKRSSYICLLPECGFTTSFKVNFTKHCTEVHPNLDVICQICLNKGHEKRKFSMTCLLVHLFDQHKSDFQQLPSDEPQEVSPPEEKIDNSIQPGKIRLRRISGDLLSRPASNSSTWVDKPEESANNESETTEKNQTFEPVCQITSVRSLAFEEVVPEKQKEKKSFITIEPIVVGRHKTTVAFTTMLKLPQILHLYKCPINRCAYSTNNKLDFGRHFLVHRFNQIVNCIYCLQAISCNNILLHIDENHSLARYQCAYCLYRTVHMSFMKLHLHEIHPSIKTEPMFYNLGLPHDSSNVCFIKSIERSRAILPFVCTQDCCNECYYTIDEYESHINSCHGQVYKCSLCPSSDKSSNIAEHYLVHSIGKYQCKYCVFGTLEVDEMMKHYMNMHPCCSPFCYIRYYKKQSGNKNYTLEDLLQINMEDFISKDVTIDFIDLSKENQSNEKKTESENFCEPQIIVKHKSTDSVIAVVNAIDPLSVDNNQSFDEDGNLLQTEKSLQINESLTELNKSPASINETPLQINESPEELNEPLSVDTSPLLLSDSPRQLNDSFNSSTDILELKGTELYRCGTTNCEFSADNYHDFKNHLFNCDVLANDNGNYVCFHCKKTCLSIGNLCGHIQIHGLCRFYCSLCSFKCPLNQLIIKHMKTAHKIMALKFKPCNPKNLDLAEGDFIAIPPKTKARKFRLNTQALVPVKLDFSTSKVTFGPEDIHFLPRPPVYAEEIHCKLCNYNTKVRSNMQRHLQQHVVEKTVPETAPVNPVPCLEKNEKMFDKMTNLAASSHSGRMGGKSPIKKDTTEKKESNINYPAFVPSNKRYVCGVANCNYLTHVDSMLRHHLEALHEDESCYKCVHCQLEIPAENSSLNIDKIIFHLKMHDLHLYKCPICDFIHYQKHKVQKHLVDSHSDSSSNIEVIRELDNSANLQETRPVISPNVSPKKANENAKPWRCSFCDHNSESRTSIQKHVSNVHNMKSLYKCLHCSYRCSAKNNFTAHFKAKHPNEPVEMMPSYYRVTESENTEEEIPKVDNFETEVFDTTPIWVKNKSTIKHIRGILVDDSKTSTKKSPKITESISLGENKEEKISSNSQYIIPKTYGSTENNYYVCPACNVFKTTDLIEFSNHLREDLKYYRCACAYCDLRFTNTCKATEHWKEKHQEEGKPKKYTHLSPHGKLEHWIDKCVQHQVKEIRKFKEPPTEVLLDIKQEEVTVQEETKKQEEEKIEANKLSDFAVITPIQLTEQEWNKVCPLKCMHCDFTTKNTQSLRKHVKRHVVFHPFQCANCDYKSATEKSVAMHHRLKHPNLEFSVKRLPKSDGPLIRPVKRKRAVQRITISKKKNKVENSDDLVVENNIEYNKNDIDDLDSEMDMKIFEPKIEIDESCSEILYICLRCPRRSDNLSAIRDHYLSTHDIQNGLFKYKKVTLDKMRKKLQYKCKYCNWFGNPDGLKQHHMDKHNDMDWICEKAMKYRCTLCKKVFDKIKKIHKHYLVVHSTERFSFETLIIDSDTMENRIYDVTEYIEEPIDSIENIFDTTNENYGHNLLYTPLKLNEDELKKYKCPVCNHGSNSYPALSDHVRGHNKPYKCSHCDLSFSYPNQVKSHHVKDHRNLTYKLINTPNHKKILEQLRGDILILNEEGTYVKKSSKKRPLEDSEESPSKVTIIESPNSVRRNVAKKSTSLPAKRINVAKKSTSNKPISSEGYSFYRKSALNIDEYKDCKSRVQILDTDIPITVGKMIKIINLFPSVVVEDCVLLTKKDIQ